MGRNTLADRLKGYACFLVLFGHVIMGIRSAGVPVPVFFEDLEQFIWSFHVALFLFLSGVVYRLTGGWKSKKTKLGFIKHKLISLGIPYVLFSLVYILINSLVPGANTQASVRDALDIWKTPIAQYWFLYALFFLFCIWTALGGVLKNWQITAAVVIISYLLPLTGLSWGSLETVLYSALAFGVGTCMDLDWVEKLKASHRWKGVLFHAGIGVWLVVCGWSGATGVKEGMQLLGILGSILLISLLQRCKPIAGFLDFMNRYSFQIYLLHTIFTAGTRILLLRLGFDQWWLHVVLGFAAGLGFSVAAALVARKIPVLDACFFPQKYLRKKKSK